MGAERPLFGDKRKKKGGLYTLSRIFMTLLMLGLAGFGLIRYYNIKSPVALEPIKIPVLISQPGKIAFKDKDNMIILCVGLDENRDEKGIIHHKGSRTDTIFLLSLDKKATRLGMLSIPRDTFVHISDDYGEDKINSAYSHAFLYAYYEQGLDYEKSKQAGLKQVRRTVEDFLGIRIDHTVLIKIEAAKGLVDSIGGITLDVEKDMDYDDNWGNLHIHLKKGRHTLNGEQAVGYARFRHDEEGDRGRIRRQQQIIQTLVQELKKPSQIMNIEKIANVAKQNIDTDLDIYDMIDLANVYKEFDKKRIVKGTITGSDDMVGDAMIIRPDQERKIQLVKRLLKNPSDIPPGDIKVTVLNGSGVDGLAWTMGDKLVEAGFDVVDVDNYQPPEGSPTPENGGDNPGQENGRETPGQETPKKGIQKTRIVDYYQNSNAVEKISKILNVKPEIQLTPLTTASPSEEEELDFVIILGQDVKPPEETPIEEDTPDPVPLQ